MSELLLTDQTLKPVADKVLAGERLSFDDGVQLYRSPDLLAVGWLANYIREKKHGNITYYNVNRHINPTNVCVAHCKLCAFGRDPDSPGAYTYALDEIYQRADGSVEIPAILLGGQAGFILAGALIGWGSRETRSARMRAIAYDLFAIVGGAACLLVWAGMVEAFVSQYHQPVLPYALKIAFGICQAAGLAGFLGWAGRE